jgi:transglutaminase-like putative cysteine protease
MKRPHSPQRPAGARAAALAAILACSTMSAFVDAAGRTPAPATAAAAAPAAVAAPAERAFTFTYHVELTGLPKDAAKVDLWIPYPVSDEHQSIADVQVKAPGKTFLAKDKRYGNSILSLELEHPAEGPVSVDMTFHARRTEYLRHDLDPMKEGPDRSKRAEERAARAYLAPDKLVPLSDRVKGIAAKVTKGKSTDIEKARAIYDYVVSTMSYDKTGTGWGNGDINWACDARRGNCTDFHAFFIGLCRASGIPARFSIGFPLPAARGAGEVAGYHCWAEFYVNGFGWIPVDASEAAKHPEKREYYFGAHDENRVQMSTGRDIVLAPKQAGEPRNYFVYPYVEVDGKPFTDGVQKKFSFRDDGVPAS